MIHCTVIDTQSTINLKLTSDHQAHIEARGIYSNWAAKNCQSFDISNATVMLGYKAKSAGIMLISDEYGQWQFRPDDPWASNDGKMPKYRTGKGEYDAFLAKHPTINGYWSDLDALKARCFTIDGQPYILITEGGFKSIMGCQHDIPTIGLVGVTMGLTPKAKGEPDLIPALKRLAEAGFGFIFAFDADAATNKNVRIAEAKLSKVLAAYGCPVKSVTGFWEPGINGETKGMDDFINKKGIEEFRAILMRVNSTVEAPDTRDTKTKKPPTPREIAARLAEEYRPNWKYHEEQQTWRRWTGKCWEKMKIGPFKSLIVTTLDAKNVTYSGIEYVNNVVEMLKCYLREVHWQTWDKSRYINFENCVLDGDTLKTLPHSPGTGFTSHLPYPYQPLTGDLSVPLEALKENCPNIHQFFQTAMQGDAKKMFKLLAIINSCLRFNFYGYQQFVHFIGVPGSGKGTCARLMEKIVGKENSQPCSLDSLKDGSTIASIIDKQLVVFGDERKPVGVESILRLTGGDNINYREVYQPAASAYFYGLLLICSNDPIFMGNTTGLDRRVSLVNFENAIPKALRNSEMEASFDGEIASLIAIALSLPHREVKQAIQGIGDAEIADFKVAEWDMKVRMDSLAAFFEMDLIVEEGAQVRAGDLFNRYKYFCEEIKKPAMSLTTFSPGLEKLCSELHQPVIRDRTGRHVTFIGLKLRGTNDDHPYYSQKLTAIAGLNTPNAGLDAGLDAGLATISSKDLQDLQDLPPNILENCEISEKKVSEVEIVKVKEITSQSPATPAKSLPTKAPSAAQSPAQAQKTPALSPATKHHHKEFSVGDRVRILDNGLHHGKDGEILVASYGSADNDYRIALDKESHLGREVVVTVSHSQKFPILMNL